MQASLDGFPKSAVAVTDTPITVLLLRHGLDTDQISSSCGCMKVNDKSRFVSGRGESAPQQQMSFQE